MIRSLPASSLTVQASHPGPVWGDTEHLLAGIFDLLAGANWQRAGKGPRPKPLKRPGDKRGETRYGKAIPIDIAKERLKRRRVGRAS